MGDRCVYASVCVPISKGTNENVKPNLWIHKTQQQQKNSCNFEIAERFDSLRYSIFFHPTNYILFLIQKPICIHSPAHISPLMRFILLFSTFYTFFPFAQLENVAIDGCMCVCKGKYRVGSLSQIICKCTLLSLNVPNHAKMCNTQIYREGEETTKCVFHK